MSDYQEVEGKEDKPALLRRLQTAINHQRQGELNEAQRICEEVLSISAELPEALHLLGMISRLQGNNDSAVELITKAILADPTDPSFHNNLGIIHRSMGRNEEAVSNYRAALRLKPEFAECLSNLGFALQALGRLKEAAESCLKAIKIKPTHAEAYSNLGAVLSSMDRPGDAIAACEKALSLNPRLAEAHLNLASAYHHKGQLVDALDHVKKCLQLRPDHREALQIHASLLGYMSNYEGVVELSNKAVAREPVHGVTWELRLYTLSYHPDLTADEIFSEFVRWGDRFKPPTTDFSQHDRTPSRRLKVGYVSPDFRRHTSRFYFWPFFANHDHAAVELYAYSNVKQDDEFTVQFKQLFDHWRDIRLLSDSNAAKQIQDDGIDILVDCCNHMRDDRLGVFALKPAPIQVTWLGAAWTTGLKAVDYAFFDPYIAPAGTLAREEIVRLPNCFVPYNPPTKTAEVAEAPCLQNGYITFGYSGRTERLNHRTFSVWGRILKKLPDARLLLDFRFFTDKRTQEYYRQFLSSYGVDIERVIFRNSPNIFEGLGNIDILLDSFPHNGGTMLFDAVWMGVPVLTLAGRPPLGRIGTTIMVNLGLPELVANSEEDYIEKACSFDGQFAQLNTLRQSLRGRMQASPIMDGRGFAQDVEDAYRKMWSRFCTGTRD